MTCRYLALLCLLWCVVGSGCTHKAQLHWRAHAAFVAGRQIAVHVLPEGETQSDRLEALYDRYPFVEPPDERDPPNDSDEDGHRQDDFEIYVPPPVKLPIAATVLGRRFAVGDGLFVITTEGTSARKITALARPGNGMDDRLVLLLDGPVSGGPLGLAVHGIKVAAQTKLRPPAVADLSRPASKALLARIQARLLADVTTEQSKQASSVVLKTDHVEMVAGRFPGGATALISVDVPELKNTDGTEHYTALFLADDAGRVIRYIYKPEIRIEFYPILWLVDVDGDGSDEVLFGVEYYEGDYIYLLRWKAGLPVTEEISGEGV